MSFRKFLSQRTVMPYSATPPKPAITRSSSGSRSSATSRIGRNGTRAAMRIDAGDIGGQRLDLEPVDGDDGVAVVHQMVREREAGRPEPDHQHLAPGRGPRQRALDVERVPARQQRIDFEAPGQRQHVLEHARLDLRDVDRLLLLVDAGLHAVVADAVAGRGAHRIVDDRDGERADGVALRLPTRFISEIFSSSGQPASTTPNGLFLNSPDFSRSPLRAGILALVVAPDAVVGVIERAGEIHSGIGERKAVARAPLRRRQLEHGDAVDHLGLDRHEMIGIDLVRHLEQHAALVPALAVRPCASPRRRSAPRDRARRHARPRPASRRRPSARTRVR